MPNQSTIPAVQSRLIIDPLGNFTEKRPPTPVTTSTPSAPPIIATAQGEYDSSSEIACARCSHDGCVHFHSAQRRLDRRTAQGFLLYTENTLFTKHSRGEMPGAIAGPPLEFDTCHLAAFKYDGVVLPQAQYDRTAHLAAVPVARADRERRLREKSAKLSAHMRRRHAATASARRIPAPKRTTAKGGAR